MAARPDTAPLVRIGISACILGHEVRWNSGHKLDAFVKDTLGRFVEFTTVCPEVEAGLGVPRPPVRLVRRDHAIHVVDPRRGADHTAALAQVASRRVAALAELDLDGFIVQKGSPSCGMERVKVYGDDGGMPSTDGRGVFTAELMRRLPHLPVEEDGRLHDPRLRESFVERIFAYRRLRALFDRPWALGELVSLHAREKFLVLAHDRVAYQALGQLVAGAKRRRKAEVADQYQAHFLAGLRRVSSRGKHANVLQHLAGFCKNLLDAADRAELTSAIDDYRRGELPLIVPITLLRHHVRRHQIEYLMAQSYLEPHPRELMLRNHA